MVHVVAEACIDCVNRSCVKECPVDCIYEGARSLYIQPAECIDCGACVPACPVEAIYHEEDLPDSLRRHLKNNEDFLYPDAPRPVRAVELAGWRQADRARRCRYPADGIISPASRDVASVPAAFVD